MTEIGAHEDFVRCNRKEKVAALALVDRYQEELGLKRSHALRMVGGIRKSRRDAVEMAQAAELLRPDSRYRALLLAHVWAESPVQPTGTSQQVVLVAGSRPPAAGRGRVHPRRSWWMDVTVLVGARWILKCWRERVLHQEASAAFG